MDFYESDFLNIGEEKMQPMQKKLLERYGHKIYSYILEKTGSRETARELTPQIIIDLYDRIQASNTKDSLEILIMSMADSKINGILFAGEDFGGIEKMIDAATEEDEACVSCRKQSEYAVKSDSPEKRSCKQSSQMKETPQQGLAGGWIVLIAVWAAIGTFVFASYIYSVGLESFLSSVKDFFNNLPMMRLFM